MPHATFAFSVTGDGVNLRSQMQEIADSIREELRSLTGESDCEVNIRENTQRNQTILEVRTTIYTSLPSDEFRNFYTEMEENKRILEETLEQDILLKFAMSYHEFSVDVECDSEELEDYDED